MNLKNQSRNVPPLLLSPCPENLPLKARPIFQAAHTGTASHLLTGDFKDFSPIMNRPDLSFGIVVQTAAEFLVNL